MLVLVIWKLKLFPNSHDPDLWPMTFKYYIRKWWILLFLPIWLEQNRLKSLNCKNCKNQCNLVGHCIEKTKEKMCCTALFMPFRMIYYLEIFSRSTLTLGANNEGLAQMLSQLRYSWSFCWLWPLAFTKLESARAVISI